MVQQFDSQAKKAVVKSIPEIYERLLPVATSYSSADRWIQHGLHRRLLHFLTLLPHDSSES